MAGPVVGAAGAMRPWPRRLVLWYCTAIGVAALSLSSDTARESNAPPPPLPPPDTSLKMLTVGGAPGLKLTPAFTPKTTSYTVVELPAALQLTATATPNASGAVLSAAGTGWDSPVPLVAGERSPPVNLTAASSQLTILVTSADKRATLRYTITATFAPSPPASVGLSSINISASSGAALVLVPAFNSSAPPTTRYTVNAPDGIDHVKIAAMTLDRYSSFIVSGSSPPSPPILRAGMVVQKLASFQQGVTIVVTGGDRKTTKSFAVQINSTVCSESPVANGDPCPDTYQGATCTASCARYYKPIGGVPHLVCTMVTTYQMINGENVSTSRPTWTTAAGPGGLLQCGLIPPPPLPTGGTYKCMNGSTGFNSGNVTHNGIVIFNGTWFNGNPGPGCSACDCCLDYISDCEACVKKCYATPTTHFVCGSPPPHDHTVGAASYSFDTDVAFDNTNEIENVNHPGPPPIACVVKPGPRNRCVNSSSPGVATAQMEFATSRCDGKCGAVAPFRGPFQSFPPQGNGIEWVCETKAQNATSNSTNWRCNVCEACCREDVDCAACVKARCPPAGAVFACQSGHCTPVNTFWTGGTLYTDTNCTQPVDAKIAPTPGHPACPPVPVDPSRVGRNYRCFGASCLLISAVYPLGDFRSANCNNTCGRPPQPPPSPPSPPSPPQPPPPPISPSMTPHSLHETDPTALCMDGTTPEVYAYVSPTHSKQWVILLGTTSVGLDICISRDACSLAGKRPEPPGSPPPPSKPPSPPVALEAGPQSTNCSINPDWCQANHAMIPMCDFTLFLSDMDEVVTASGCPIPGTCCAKPTMTFRGRRILIAALHQLIKLGMNDAEEILLVGVGFGGTAAILNADFLAAQLKPLARRLHKFKVLPVDGIRPKDPPDFDGGPQPWLAGALRTLDTLANLTKGTAHPDCLSQYSDDTSICLNPTVALRYMASPVFLVQEFPSVWDTQCLFDGAVSPNSILQVQCSDRTSMYNCAQYSDLCPKDLVQTFFVPIQKQYVAQTAASGLSTRLGSGAFFHGCYIGAYFFGKTLFARACLGFVLAVPEQAEILTVQLHTYESSELIALLAFWLGNRAMNYTECYPPPCVGKRVVAPERGIWQIIMVKNVTMQGAISSWWHGSDTAPTAWHVDSYWNPDGVPPPNHNLTQVHTEVETRRRLVATNATHHDALDAERAMSAKADRARGATRRRGPPPVPWYVSRFMTNPTCRGFPWY